MFNFLGIPQFAQTVKLLFSSLEMVVSAEEKPLTGTAEDVSSQKKASSLLAVMAFKELPRAVLTLCQPHESLLHKQ